MTRSISAIYVDDDPFALEMFEQSSSEILELSLKQTFTNAKDALDYLVKNKTDVLFSDIEMPNKTGLWLAEQLEKKKIEIEVVFITAHSGYATQAFEACALDYLLKPLQTKRLEDVVERIVNRMEKYQKKEQIDEFFHNYMGSTNHPQRIFVQNTGQMHVVKLSDVIYFSASGVYTKVHSVSNEDLISSKGLKTYAEALENHPDFVRIHRSFLINKFHVKIMHQGINKFSVTMVNGDQLEVSQRRKNEIFDELLR